MDETAIRAAMEMLQRELDKRNSPGLTLRQLGQLWWEAEGQHRRIARDYRRRLDVLVSAAPQDGKPPLGDRDAMSITRSDMNDLKSWLASQRTRRGKPPAAATINLILDRAHRIYEWACEQDPSPVPRNPIAGLKRIPENNRRKTTLGKPGELERLLQAANPLVRALVLSLADSGARRGIILSLRWSQIDWDGGWITGLPAAAGNKNRGKPCLSPRALEAIRAIPRFNEYVFSNPRTRRPYHWRYLYTLYKRAVRDAGLVGTNGEPITLHTLRHRFAYVARRYARLPEKVIMQMGGWKTRSAFDRYGDVDEGEIAEAYDSLAERIRRAQEEEDARRMSRRGPARALTVPVARTAADNDT